QNNIKNIYVFKTYNHFNIDKVSKLCKILYAAVTWYNNRVFITSTK
ncbi:unnamed protein product, partial [marine sediment metagenome]